MAKRFFFVCAGLLCLAVVYHLGTPNARANAESRRPWLEPHTPSELEWLTLSKQATEGDTEFGSNGMTVNFYLRPESMSAGTVYCDLAYLPEVSAEVVQLVEEGIRNRFRITRQTLPWAKVQILPKVARPPSNE